jgi:penicillin V acylase-like amidase (Ntn superfamily)
MKLQAPYLPFDGMNEHGLAIGMAAVPESTMPHDAN